MQLNHKAYIKNYRVEHRLSCWRSALDLTEAETNANVANAYEDCPLKFEFKMCSMKTIQVAPVVRHFEVQLGHQL